MKVRWDHSLSESFHVSNGVRQGGVLSPVLFAVYLDGLLEELADSGCGCYWRNLFAGTFCYADDIVLLAPCASALRVMLNICWGLIIRTRACWGVAICHTRIYVYLEHYGMAYLEHYGMAY